MRLPCPTMLPACLLLAGIALAGEAPPRAPEPPAYPEPQIWEAAAGTFEVKGCSLFLPAGSGAKAGAVAAALKTRLGAICAAELPLKETPAAPGAPLLLCVGRNAPDWKALAGKLDMARLPAAEAAQGYVLDIAPDGAAIAARTALGLSYGAVTLMDVARRAGGNALPCMRITDWPDMPVRGFYGTHVFDNSTVYAPDIAAAARLAPLVKQRLLVLELDTGAFRLEGHPELHRTGSWDRKAYTDMVRLPSAEGIEVVPWVQMGKSISLRFGVPYAPLDDDDPTYLWGFETVADEVLEVFLPKSFCVGMNEDWHFLFGPLHRRDKKQWREAAARFAEHLRRRGVSTWAVADYLLGPNGMGYGGAWAEEVRKHDLTLTHRPIEFYQPLLERQGLADSETFFQGSVLTNPRTGYPSKPNEKMSDQEFDRRFNALMTEYRAYAESFPRDFVFFPKQSSPPQTVAFGNMADAGCRTIAFSPYVGNPNAKRYPAAGNGRMWAAAIRYLRRDAGKPAALGCISGEFGGGWYSTHAGVGRTQNVLGAGPQWKVDSAKDDFEDCRKRFVAPSAEETRASLAWRCLLDADPTGTPAETIARLKDPTWHWVEAREEAVARGMPLVPALLEAMRASEGELRQRFEGCVSRIARDARNGIDRGALDVKSVERYLSEARGDVANIAAEAIGASGPEGTARLAAGLAVPREAAACAWAVRYTPCPGAGAKLCAMLAAGGFPPEARVNAARSAGLLRAKEAAGPLAGLIRKEKEPAVQREAAWALALLGAREHDKAVATLLQSPDRATRCRAVMALAVLRSPELLKTEHMLASDDRNEAWIATWALFPGHVFDRFICTDREWSGKPVRGEQPPPAYDRAKTYYRVHLDMLDIAEAVPRDAALKLLAAAAPRQKDELLRELMERIPKEPGGFEYQNRPHGPRK